MSATRTAQAYPGNQNLAAALGVVILAIAVMLVLAFGVLTASKATVSTPASGAAPAAVRPRLDLRPGERLGRVGPGDLGPWLDLPTRRTCLVSSSKSFTRGNHLSMPR